MEGGDELRHYVSLQQATQYCNYSQEYLSLRARQGKLRALKFGRNWVTKKEWVEEYFQKAEEYNNNFKIKKFALSTEALVKAGAPPENLPVAPHRFWSKAVRGAFVMALAFVLVAVGIAFGKDSFKNVYQELNPIFAVVSEDINGAVSKLGENLAEISLPEISLPAISLPEISVPKISMPEISLPEISLKKWFSSQTEEIVSGLQMIPEIFSEKYFAANEFLEEKISQGWQGIKNYGSRTSIVLKEGYRAITQPWRAPPEKVPEEVITVKEVVEKEVVKEVVKEVEVSKITKIEPIKEVTKEVIKIDDKELAKIKTQISALTLWGADINNLREITKKLQATPSYTPVASAPIYIGYQGIQVGGTGTFASLGVSGSAGITNLGVGGSTSLGSTSSDTLTVNATSYFKAPVTFGISALTIDTAGNLSTTGNITTTGGGDLIISGDLTVAGTQTYSGAATFNVNTATPALTITQSGTGLVLDATGSVVLSEAALSITSKMADDIIFRPLWDQGSLVGTRGEQADYDDGSDDTPNFELVDTATGPGGRGWLVGAFGESLTYKTSGNIQNTEGTLSLWYSLDYAYNDANNHYIFQAGNVLRLFYDATTDKFTFQAHDGTGWGNDEVLSAAQTFLADSWHHLVVTWDNDTSPYLEMYLNNTKTTGGDGWTAQALPADFYIGSSSTPDQLAQGVLTDFAIFDRVLTQQEIQQIYYLRRPIEDYAATTTPYYKTLIVAKSGGDYQTITAALGAIPDTGAGAPSITNPWLILVKPGTYSEAVTMEQYVDIIGSGSDSTKIERSTATVITTASNAKLEGFTINKTTDNANAIISVAATSPTLTNLVITGAGTTSQVAIDITSGSPRIENIRVSNTNTGITAATGSPIITNLKIGDLTAVVTGIKHTGTSGTTTVSFSIINSTTDDIYASGSGATIISSNNILKSDINNFETDTDATIESTNDKYALVDNDGTFRDLTQTRVFTEADDGVDVGEVVYLSVVDTVDEAKADSTTTMPAIGVVVKELGTQLWVKSAGIYYQQGAGWTAGGTYYVSAATAGAITTTKPAGEIAQVIGVAKSTEEFALLPVGGGGEAISYQNVLTVSPDGGDYTTIQAAIDAVSSPIATNRWLIVVYPGVYSEVVTLDENYTDLIGIGGPEVTKVTQADTTVFTVTSNNNRIEGFNFDISADTTGKSVVNLGTSPNTVTLENIKITWAGSGSSTGVAITSGSPQIKRATITQVAKGITITSGSPMVTRSDMGATDIGVSIITGGGTVTLTYNIINATNDDIKAAFLSAATTVNSASNWLRSSNDNFETSTNLTVNSYKDTYIKVNTSGGGTFNQKDYERNDTLTALTVTQSGTGDLISLSKAGAGQFVIASDGQITATITKDLAAATDKAVYIKGPGTSSTAGTLLYIENEDADVTPLYILGQNGNQVFKVDNAGILTLSNATDGTGSFTLFDAAGEKWEIGVTAGTLSYTNPITITTAANNLTISTTASGDIAVTSAGALAETFAATGGYQLKRGAEAILAVDAAGAIAITARGTDQNITLTPSGAGVITLAKNVDATAGLDVSGANFSYAGTAGSWTIALADSALTQIGTGQVTFTGNVDATAGLDVTNASLTVGGTNFTVTTSGEITSTITKDLTVATEKAVYIKGPGTGSTAGTLLYIENEDANVTPILVLDAAGGNILKLADTGDLTISGNLMPFSAATTNYIGSDTVRWDFGYFGELHATTLAAENTSISGTIAQTFTINTDAAGDEDSNLVFYRGASLTAAHLAWNAATDRFDFNFPIYLSGTGIITFAGAGSIATTDTTNITMTAADAGDKTFVLAALNSAAGGAILDIDAKTNITLNTAGGSITIGAVGATAGDLILSSGDDTTIDATGLISLDSADSSNFTVTGSTKNLTLAVAGGGAQQVILQSAGTGTNAVYIQASDVAGGIDIDAGTTSGTVTINAGGAITLTSAGINLAAGSSEIDLTTTGALDLNSGAGTWDASTLSIDSTDTTNITMTAAADGVDKTLTIQSTNTGTGAGLMSILAEGNLTLNSSGGTLQLNSTDNKAINTGTGLLTAGGDLTVSGQDITGGAATTSLNIVGAVTGAAPAQRDIVFQTGNNANPQVLATRLTIGSNAATPDIDIANANLDLNNNIITNIGASGTNFIASTGALTLAGVLTANGGVTVAGGQNLTMSSGTGQFSQTFSGAATVAHSITASAVTTGNVLALSSTSAAASSSDLISGNHTATYVTTVADSGNLLDLSRALTTNTGGALTISGPLATFSSNCTQTAGTCTDSANILSLTQSYASATGAVLAISNSGTGPDILGTSSTWSVSKVGAANFVSIGATTAGSGAFTTLSAFPGSDVTALTLTGTNVTSANLAYLNVKNTSGTIFNIAYGAPATQGAGALTGLSLNLNTNLTAPTAGQNVTDIALQLPAASTTSNTTVYAGLDLSAAGAITNATAGTFAWRGANIVLPVITQSAGGSVTASGLRVLIPASGAIVTAGTMNAIDVIAPTTSGPAAGTLVGLNIAALTSAGAAAEYAIQIGAGWDRGISLGANSIVGTTANIDLTYFDVAGTTGAVTIDPQTTGTYLDFTLETAWISGTLINADFASATTLTGAVTGISLNLNTSVTPNSGSALTAMDVQTPVLTASGTTTTNFRGYQISAAGALDTTATGGLVTNVNWYGMDIQMPNIDTGEAGDITTSYGMYIRGGTVTNGLGTESQYGLIVDSAAGNVGIGTTAPTSKLTVRSDVAAGANEVLRLENLQANAVGTTVNLGIYLNKSGDASTQFGAINLTTTSIDSTYYAGKMDINTASNGVLTTMMEIGNPNIVLSRPVSVTTGGDVGISYDLAFLSTGISYITAQGPLTISAGDPNSAENLVLTTRSNEAAGDSGVATAGAATTLTDGTKAWTADAWIGGTISIIAGSGKGQTQVITDNTTTVITVADWSTTLGDPAASSVYHLAYARGGDVVANIQNSDLAYGGFRILGMDSGGYILRVGPDGDVVIGGSGSGGSDLTVKQNITLTGGNITINKLSTPTSGVATCGTVASGGLNDGTYYYRVSAINDNGETLALAEFNSGACAAGAGLNKVTVSWNAVTGVTAYKVYGRSIGAELYMKTVSAPTNTYTDANTETPSGALPSTNTTGGDITGILSFSNATEVTIDTNGDLTVTQTYHRVDTFGDAASDDLDTINGGTAGDILVLRTESAARDVTLTSTGGNLKVATTCVLDETSDTAVLVFDGTNWLQLACNASNTADIAENYYTEDLAIEAGDVVKLASLNSELLNEKERKQEHQYPSIAKTGKAYDSGLVGVITTSPSITLGGYEKLSSGAETRSVALVGRVPVKVSLENGPVAVGDFLTASSTSGVAMKASGAGQVIGRALESFEGFVTECEVKFEKRKVFDEAGIEKTEEEIVLTECQTVPSEIGKVMTMINVGWQGYDLSVITNENGEIVQTELQQGLASLGLQVNDYGSLVVGKLTAKEIITEQLTVQNPETANTGITLFDRSTGQPYCLFIIDGNIQTLPGECIYSTPEVEYLTSGVDGSSGTGEGSPPPDVCDATHLDLCLNETDCQTASGYWYNDVCNAEPETPACTDEACGTTSCDPDGTLHLTGSCQNVCLNGSCQSCTPECQ